MYGINRISDGISVCAVKKIMDPDLCNRRSASSVLGKYAGKNFCMADYTGKKRIIEYSAYETWYYR